MNEWTYKTQTSQSPHDYTIPANGMYHSTQEQHTPNVTDGQTDGQTTQHSVHVDEYLLCVSVCLFVCLCVTHIYEWRRFSKLAALIGGGLGRGRRRNVGSRQLLFCCASFSSPPPKKKKKAYLHFSPSHFNFFEWRFFGGGGGGGMRKGVCESWFCV